MCSSLPCIRTLVEINKRRILWSVFICIWIISLLTFFAMHIYTYTSEIRFYTHHLKLLKEAKIRAGEKMDDYCHIPDLDPFDPSVMIYFKKFKLHCKDTPYLTYMDDDGYLHLNESGFKVINVTYDEVVCSYNSIAGVEGKKKLVRGQKMNVYAHKTEIKDEFICVQCRNKINNATRYGKCHFQVPKPSEELQKRNLKLRENGRANVLLLGIDSLSRLSFIRNLPKSYDFLMTRLKSVIMKGYNKVGKNTHPNLIPFLSGYRMYRQEGDPTPAICTGDCDIYFDALPVVWHNFSQAGYVTMWLEEWLIYQLFYYDAKGFKVTPTDYFPRPLIQGFEDMTTNTKGLCYGNTPTHDVVLDYTKKFVARMRDTVHFALSYIARVSHDDDFQIQALDDSLKRFMEKLLENGYFNNTIFVLFSDHGRRFGSIRSTMIGTLEDRMPFLSIYLPEGLRRENPHLQTALQVNSGRLTSGFDMYELLMDLAMDNLGPESRVPQWGYGKGSSLLRPVPINRTCSEAGVPEEYCICMTPLEVPITEDGVQTCGRLLVRLLNKQLKTVPGRPCASLKLSSLDVAHLLSPSQNVLTPRGLIVYLRVTVTVLPSKARLQATFQRRASDLTWTMIGEVERLDTYKDQVHCITNYTDTRIRPYCYCFEEQTKATVSKTLLQIKERTTN